MPRKLPPNVDRVGKYLYFRVGKGARIALPRDPTSQEFRDAYACALSGSPVGIRTSLAVDKPRSIGALIVSYRSTAAFKSLNPISKSGYITRLERMRLDHGHRAVGGLTKERIETMILAPLADRPGSQLDTLKKLRILISHAIDIRWLNSDPSHGIKRPKGREIRAWTDAEMRAYERRWPIGTKQRTAYAIMLYVGSARVDTHEITWRQLEDGLASYARSKTGVAVHVSQADELQAALASWPRKNITVLNTEYGKTFTVDGFSRFMRDAINAAGLPLDCKPHGLRKTLGRLLADAGATAHEIMAVLGHTTLAEAERYTREADRRRGGRAAIKKLSDHRANTTPQTHSQCVGKGVKR